jgi:hypothetical protein
MDNASSNDMNNSVVSGSTVPQVTNDTSVVETTADSYSESPSPLNTIIKGEIKMADIVTGTVTGSVDTSSLQQDHADIRRESAVYAGDIRREVASAACDVNKTVSFEGQENVIATKDARHDIIQSNDSVGDRVVDRISELRGSMADRFYAVGQDTADLRAQLIQAIDTTKLSTELNALKGIIEGQKNTTYLSDKISHENEKTRDLINDLKYHDLNRGLVERNTALIECESDRNHWRTRADQNQFQGQWAALQSQIQAFASQLQETRQGMVNFGTMAGVGQTSTSNNVQ